RLRELSWRTRRETPSSRLVGAQHEAAWRFGATVPKKRTSGRMCSGPNCTIRRAPFSGRADQTSACFLIPGMSRRREPSRLPCVLMLRRRIGVERHVAQAKTTTDHDEIRKWAEERGGRPSVVRTDGEGGILRIDFQEPDENLEEISWED